MSTVFFYISGHGFGHAVRQIEIINTLQQLAPAVRVAVRTTAPEWLFARTIRAPVTWLPGATDTGVVQIDGLRLDAGETVRRAAVFYEALPRAVEIEAALLRDHGARFVVADAPPLACAAADATGIASAVCSNFTWDWIYQAYVDPQRPGAPIIPAIRNAYRTATGWRLPFGGGFESVARVLDMPLVARHARPVPREEIRTTLRLPINARLVLVSFGGYGVRDLPLARLDCVGPWEVVVTTRGEEEPLPAGIHAVREDHVYGSGLHYEDLVRAVDVVLTKPGYGIVSDCIANGTAILYTSRGRFPEYDVLVANMPRYLRCAFLGMEPFLDGRWSAGLEAVDSAPAPRERLATDGARAVADRILTELTTAAAPPGGSATSPP